MQEVYQFLKETPTFYLATCQKGQPRVRPFGAVCLFEGGLYLITNREKDVFGQIKANPQVEISTTNGQGEWIRLTARLAEDDRREARVQMLAENPSLSQMYTPDDGKMVVLRLENATAIFCSFTAAPKTVTF